MIKYFIPLLILIFLSSCASLGPTKPNTPYSGDQYPPILAELAQKNPPLVRELGRLPELQDGISPEESENLRQLNEIYMRNPAAFDKLFIEMYQVGISSVRRYCSPLQAFYWLIEDKKIDAINEVISAYSLEKLLNFSWKYRESSNRWSDFDAVVERLNDPILLNQYINANITYRQNRVNSNSPNHTFTHHWGDCDDLAVFGDYILKNAGYKPYCRFVHWTSDNRGHVGVLIRLVDGSYLLVIDFISYGNIISGPYTNLSKVDEKLAHGHSFHHSGWWEEPRLKMK